MQFFFAHAGETHDTAVAATSHSLWGTLTKWYLAIPLFIALVALVAFITYWVSRKSKAVTYNIVLVTLFVAGVATYTISAPVSVLSLSVGFAMALVQVLIGLTTPHHEVKEK